MREWEYSVQATTRLIIEVFKHREEGVSAIDSKFDVELYSDGPHGRIPVSKYFRRTWTETQALVQTQLTEELR